MTNRKVVLGGLMLGMLLAALDQTITATAMPTVVRELGGLAHITWVTTAYMLAATAVVPIVGKLADLFGRRLWFLIGMALFILGSALCGAAQSMTQLILFRGIQGVGGGMLMPVVQTIIGDLFPGPERARMQGLFAGVFGLASVAGPKLGGWIVDSFAWRWVFYINLPLGIAAAVVVALSLKETLGTEKRPIDYWGSLTVAGGVTMLMLGLVQGGQAWAWSAWQSIALLGGAAALLVAFVLIEARVPEPVLPLTVFRSRVFSVMSALVFLMGAGMFGTLVFIPLFMQGVVGISASESGTVLTPMTLGMVVSSIAGGRMLTRVGYRTQLTAGMMLLALGFYAMTTMGIATTQAVASSFMVLAGLGLGLVMPTVTIVVQNTFDQRQRGVVTSAINFFRSIGSTLGITILGVVMNSRSAALINSGMGAVAASLPPQAAVALAPVQQMAVRDPQQLFGFLLRPEMLNSLPQVIQAPLVDLLRNSLAGAIHTVFLVGLWLAVAGTALALTVGPGRVGQERLQVAPVAE